MRLPIQSEPVQRTSIGQPGPANSVERFGAGEHGIEPNGIFDDIVNTVRGVSSVVQAGAPILSTLGGLF